jgi:hypothetical protein
MLSPRMCEIISVFAAKIKIVYEKNIFIFTAHFIG